MRLLWISSRFPLPPIKGDRLRTYHLLRNLADRHQIDLACLVTPRDREYLDPVRQLVSELQVVPFSRFEAGLRVIAAIPTGMPFQSACFTSRGLSRILRRMVQEVQYDAVVITLLRACGNVPWQPGCPVVVDLIDSMVLNMGNRLGFERGPLRLVVREELRRLERRERRLCEKIAAGVVVSQRDAEAIASDNVVVIPNGVDSVKFSPAERMTTAPIIAFTGNLSYFPNVDAVTWFAREIFPQVRRVVAGARLEVAGADPSPAVQALDGMEGVRVRGFVDDMAAFLRSARVAVCPLRNGSGIQNKALEAMACGLPTVITPIAANPINAVHGRHFLVAETAEEIAAATIRLLTDEEAALSLGRAGCAQVRQCYSWAAAAESLETVLLRAVGRQT